MNEERILKLRQRLEQLTAEYESAAELLQETSDELVELRKVYYKYQNLISPEAPENKIPCEDIWGELYEFSKDFPTLVLGKFSMYSDLEFARFPAGSIMGDKKEENVLIRVRKKNSPNERFFITLRVSNLNFFYGNVISIKEQDEQNS